MIEGFYILGSIPNHSPIPDEKVYDSVRSLSAISYSPNYLYPLNHPVTLSLWFRFK